MDTGTNITFAQIQTLYEVSQKINSQLNLQKLLDEIMDLAIALLKAEKGLIFFRNETTGELELQAARAIENRIIENFIAMSRSIIDKVADTGQPILLDKVPGFQKDNASSSLHRSQTRSVLCAPLCTPQNLIGIIYLDTTKPGHFFNKDDLSFLDAFANLVGIAIENAKSYQEVETLNKNLERIVDERTYELKQKHQELIDAYEELKSTQLQLIRSEKMASLGMFIAGIAHEINTPLGSINSNTDLFLRSFQKLRDNITSLLTASFEKNATQTVKILDAMENITNVNKEACTRIIEIVKRLKNFARLDEEEFKVVDIHEGINSTLELIRHLCSEKIEIIKDYGEIPALRCRASQLNQVFMNLLVNACQAIENIGKICIQTYFEHGTIYVAISDTGIGIAPENLSKIFDPGFTSKGVGVGTGLGLSIAYKIIEDHCGSIEVESELGKGSIFTIKLPFDECI